MSPSARPVNEKEARTLVTSPSSPAATARSTSSQRMSCENIVPSKQATCAIWQIRKIWSVPVSVRATGFSSRTCLPAAAAFCTHSTCMDVGRGMYTASMSGSPISSS